MLFDDERHHSLSIPAKDKDGHSSTIAYLIEYLCKNVMKDTRQELFVLDDHLYVGPQHGPVLPASNVHATDCPSLYH